MGIARLEAVRRGRSLRHVAIACALLAACAGGASGQSRVLSDQDILIRLERDWDAAFHRGDVAFVETVLAEEFLATYPNGTRGDRARELANVAAFDQHIDSSTLDDFIIRIYGDTAVVRFTQRLVGPMQGKPVELTFQYIDVFVYRDGRWQCVASQSTRVAG
jgi:ketosteroid isomerase-like protein